MRALLIALLCGLGVSACGIVYKVDVHQGNLLQAKDVDQLKPGLNKRQVLALLGTPSIADPFHQSRWDYLATSSKRGSKAEIKNLVLTFDGDTLATVEGDYFDDRNIELIRDMRRYGNLPRDERNRRRAGGGRS